MVKPKFYYVNNKAKIKGVSGLDVAKFKEILSSKKAYYKHFVKFKESLRRKEITVNQMIDMEKTLTIEDTKRWWKHKFNPNELQSSMPLCVVDNKLFCYETYDNKAGEVEYRITQAWKEGKPMHKPIIMESY